MIEINEIQFSSAAHKRLEMEQRKFILENKDKDKYYDFSIEKKIPCPMADNTLVYCPKHGSKPWYTNKCLLIFLDLFFMGWIPRVFLNKNTNIVNYAITKYIHN
jgi:hypothetical protein